MEVDAIFGVVVGVFVGNALSIWFFLTIFKAEGLRKKGVPEDSMPGWFYLGGTVPPLLTAWLAYIALY